MTDKTLTIRQADRRRPRRDSTALQHSTAPPHRPGDVLLAEVGGELWAAVELDSGAAIADPFRPSGDLVDLLRLHRAASAARRPGRSGACSRARPRRRRR